ncbi:hypothetical protein VTI74DRAFT_1581 [Chaetomium olivicolor]
MTRTEIQLRSSLTMPTHTAGRALSWPPSPYLQTSGVHCRPPAARPNASSTSSSPTKGENTLYRAANAILATKMAMKERPRTFTTLAPAQQPAKKTTSRPKPAWTDLSTPKAATTRSAPARPLTNKNTTMIVMMMTKTTSTAPAPP